ncbi:hypothetical protein KGF57_003016 [Candida theae]|uniref:Uncharacterized protein n=1 Tax=Candida theae TaxID=1198502 RepID=A0AAD5BDU7_9ASCO|nr:uncharacterized protein KGF57_003016 [Candida theae]KAI5957750.1 hypothetical protein KGF57_003016 [Candida theae]
MQFSIVALFAATAAIVNAEITQTVESTTLATITDCGSHASSCPASTIAAQSSSAGNGTAPSNGTAPGVSTFEAGAAKQYAAGAVALAAGALLAL